MNDLNTTKAAKPAAALPIILIALIALAAGCEPPAGPSAGASATADPNAAQAVFNGKDLTGWKVLDDGFFDTAGKVSAEDGKLVLAAGNDMTGVQWTGEMPKDDYQVRLDAMRIDGGDFFCGMTFPVAGGYATLICGGWGGQVVGLSNIDGYAASENMTTANIEFESNRWYGIDLLVADGHVTVWIDNEKVIDVATEGHEFDVWLQQEDTRPFGVTTYATTGALRNITLRRVRSLKQP